MCSGNCSIHPLLRFLPEEVPGKQKMQANSQAERGRAKPGTLVNKFHLANGLFTFMLEQLFSDVHADRVRSCSVLHPLTHFATTRWTLIRAEQASPAQSAGNDALAELCQIY